ncbi:uncharacterized protein VDAG_08692 [Verticillium dahliae VdLs.17]|uniref:Uncharacterized protein n=1 Tax=Verticillium dahliae (strain VdLs.17 / ATCC MYA-4575 / FGSC 10137) TaxID=498257 RepID=G2XEW0_VERDV|nr:uncharacterized protein VDAG_08692 [Verticillium dahliae VdLs.17]EGY18358.1 hypothetical protein VDAG_08692 [Verticillium dahliae VdLs.17]KAH6686543.1 hypothetical protein EV126DRAFT_433553 [Verticillium dahliae]
MHLPRRLPHESHQNSIIFASCVFNSDLILIHRPFTYHWNRVKHDPVVDAQGPFSDERTSQEIKIHDFWMHDIFGIGSADPSPDYFMSSDVPPDLHNFLVQAWPSFLPP